MKRDRINHANDVGNLAAAIGNLPHALHHLLHHAAAQLGSLRSVRCQLVGLACGVCRLRDRRRQLFHAGCCFLQVSGGLLGTGRQVLIAAGNLA